MPRPIPRSPMSASRSHDPHRGVPCPGTPPEAGPPARQPLSSMSLLYFQGRGGRAPVLLDDGMDGAVLGVLAVWAIALLWVLPW